MMEEARSKLRGIFARALRLPPDAPPIGDTNLVKELGIDSISAMEILIWIEDEFGIVIEDADLSPRLVDSLDTILAYVGQARSRTQAEAPARPENPA
jgi:acyl carrier protein